MESILLIVFRVRINFSNTMEYRSFNCL